MQLLMKPATSSDAELWATMRATASRDAFAELFGRYADTVYNFCFRRLASWEAAEEVTQATFLAIWQRTVDRRLSPLGTDSAVGLILWQARKSMIDHARASSRRLRLIKVVEPTASNSPVDEWVEAESVQARIAEAMASIPTDQRDVIELVCWSEIPHQEAAQALGIPLGTLKSRLARGRAALRKHPALSHLKGATHD